ncbi:hypothetical protein HML84_04090 [Alcanivorax sp. IO_7]|nr:hypothetical protein HML84_04090 [Alcanivorax sp. IO_7]
MAERPYGLLARFPDAGRLLAASRDLHDRGLIRLDAYTPIRWPACRRRWACAIGGCR